ncbi:MAG: DUF6049 family protein [Actinomycetota bacterium]|nr:DUF6049 family protein [Actinomycetota bacterium]
MKRSVAVLIATFVGLLSFAALPGAPAGAQDDDGDSGALELVDQTVVVRAGEPFTMAFTADDLDPARPLQLRLHDRVRSRSELTRAIDGSGLRGSRSTAAVDLGGIPVRVDGAHQLTLTTDGQSGGLALGQPGVYPLTLTGEDTAGDDVRLVSQLVVPPPTDGVAPPLGVALLAHLGLPPTQGTEPPPVLAEEELVALAGVVDALASLEELPFTLQPQPETMVALSLATDPAPLDLLRELQALADRHPVLDGPFVAVSPDTLAGAGLSEELDRHLLAGAAVRQGMFPDAEAVEGTWVSGGGLGRAGLELLADEDIERIVVRSDDLESTNDGVLSLARPFRLVPPAERGTAPSDAAIEALVVDGSIADRLGGDEGDAVQAIQVVAELSALYFEQPTVARAAVVPIDRTTPPTTIATVGRILGTAGFLQPVDLDTAFDTAEPLVDRTGDLREVELDGNEVDRLSPDIADAIGAARGQLASLATMLSPDDTVLQDVESDLLRAEAERMASADRRAHLTDARSRIGQVVGGVTTTGTATVTLTARDGNLPITLVNDTGSALSVVLHLRSTKLSAPGGTDVPVELPVGATRVDIDIRTRASGSIPLELVVTSPDGALLLTTARYSVQSTAVSGVGVVLSGGAILFLLVWWGRHWREHRRSTKLVPADGDDGALPAGSEDPA